MSVRTEQEGGILLITLDRPRAHNALSPQMSQALCEHWCRLRDDPALRVAILTGAGDRAFCSGADLKKVADHYRSTTPQQRREQAERQPGLGGITRNLDPGKPVIAAINGHCLAGGLELALACDIRIAAEHATFGLPEVRWGLMPGAGGTQRLPRVVPLALAMQMLLTGDPIDSRTALAGGLVSRVVPQARLLDEARAIAARVASAAPLAVRAVRASVYHGLGRTLADGLRLEQCYAEPLRQSKDVQEGLRAFGERREPRFEGR